MLPSPLIRQLAQNYNHENSGTVRKAEASKATCLHAFRKARELEGKLRGLEEEELFTGTDSVYGRNKAPW